MLDLSSLHLALTSLRRAIQRSQTDLEDEELRDAVIQRFGYTYELCWKMLKRRLEIDAPTPSQIDGFSFRELMREGAERGLIEKVEQWLTYREQRNITSHTYDSLKAQSVYETALVFVSDAQSLLESLEERNRG